MELFSIRIQRTFQLVSTLLFNIRSIIYKEIVSIQTYLRLFACLHYVSEKE